MKEFVAYCIYCSEVDGVDDVYEGQDFIKTHLEESLAPEQCECGIAEVFTWPDVGFETKATIHNWETFDE